MIASYAACVVGCAIGKQYYVCVCGHVCNTVVLSLCACARVQTPSSASSSRRASAAPKRTITVRITRTWFYICTIRCRVSHPFLCLQAMILRPRSTSIWNRTWLHASTCQPPLRLFIHVVFVTRILFDCSVFTFNCASRHANMIINGLLSLFLSLFSFTIKLFYWQIEQLENLCL